MKLFLTFSDTVKLDSLLILLYSFVCKNITAGGADGVAGEEEEALPRGWHAEVNDAGEMHYQNKHTQEWTQGVPEHPAAPEGWLALPHGEDEVYWFHEATEATQWHHPHDAAPDGE